VKWFKFFNAEALNFMLKLANTVLVLLRRLSNLECIVKKEAFT